MKYTPSVRAVKANMTRQKLTMERMALREREMEIASYYADMRRTLDPKFRHASWNPGYCA